jgi:hypothetical protein
MDDLVLASHCRQAGSIPDQYIPEFSLKHLTQLQEPSVFFTFVASLFRMEIQTFLKKLAVFSDT